MSLYSLRNDQGLKDFNRNSFKKSFIINIVKAYYVEN